MIEIKVPPLGESIVEATISRWLKKDGDQVRKDEAILELETDKATVELAAEASGRLEILVQAGESVHVGDVVGRIVEGGAERETARKAEAAPEPVADRDPGKPAQPSARPAKKAQPTSACRPITIASAPPTKPPIVAPGPSRPITTSGNTRYCCGISRPATCGCRGTQC